MIIGSWDIQPLGVRQAAYWHEPGTPPGNLQPYVPIREATHEEWLAEARERAAFQGRPLPPLDHERCTYYYEISTD
jgi:hypothetical protein